MRSARTLYHAISGKRPPDAPSRMVNDEYVAAHEAALSSYRPGFLAAIDKALRLDVGERPQSIAAWRTMLLAEEPKRGRGRLSLGPRARPPAHRRGPIRRGLRGERRLRQRGPGAGRRAGAASPRAWRQPRPKRRSSRRARFSASSTPGSSGVRPLPAGKRRRLPRGPPRLHPPRLSLRPPRAARRRHRASRRAIRNSASASGRRLMRRVPASSPQPAAPVRRRRALRDRRRRCLPGARGRGPSACAAGTSHRAAGGRCSTAWPSASASPALPSPIRTSCRIPSIAAPASYRARRPICRRRCAYQDIGVL